VHGNILIPEGGSIKYAESSGCTFWYMYESGEVLKGGDLQKRVQNSLAISRERWGVKITDVWILLGGD
jgi:hypothetical protein